MCLIGLANYSRDFIHSFSTIVHPLNELLRKDVYIWMDAQQEALCVKLVDALKNTVVLKKPDPQNLIRLFVMLLVLELVVL